MTFQPTAPTETMAQAAEDISRRLLVVKKTYDDYDPKCNRRAAWDHLADVRRNLEALSRWLDGTNDTPIAWMAVTATQEGRDTYRVHYGSDALVAAIHHLLLAEYFAGTRTEEDVMAQDPWRYVDGVQQSEATRLRLAEGITFRFPTSVRP